MAQLRLAACGGKKRKERDAAGGRPPHHALSFGVGWGTHSATFEKPWHTNLENLTLPAGKDTM
jgi:hypothetical protein